MNKKRLKTIDIIELFEDLLDSKNIKIPSSDREGNEEEFRRQNCGVVVNE